MAGEHGSGVDRRLSAESRAGSAQRNLDPIYAAPDQRDRREAPKRVRMAYQDDGHRQQAHHRLRVDALAPDRVRPAPFGDLRSPRGGVASRCGVPAPRADPCRAGSPQLSRGARADFSNACALDDLAGPARRRGCHRGIRRDRGEHQCLHDRQCRSAMDAHARRRCPDSEGLSRPDQHRASRRLRTGRGGSVGDPTEGHGAASAQAGSRHPRRVDENGRMHAEIVSPTERS